ncbi:hypothetical protein CAPTEDRAFT_71969, partial [Capitella teleta]
EDFKSLPITPTLTDLMSDKLPFLRRNKITGRYRSVQHYLDVQFRLLREDFISPLRDGIKELLRSKKLGKVKQTRHNYQGDIRLYKNVHINVPFCGRNGILYKLRFDVATLKKVDWDQSKRLLTGSLLCLSVDNFKTIVFAIVSERHVNQLRRGHILIELVDDWIEFDHAAEYEMVEATAYFEAYKHNLKKMQEIEDLSFKDYILNSDVTNVMAPKYLRNPGAALVLSGKRYQALKISKWPGKEILELNQSQYSAFQNALTKEFAIIQGPPGTGKTHLGLKIMETLLNNISTWQRNQEGCILIVCHTNHALDQFLEGIISKSELKPGELVRIGGKSKSDELEPFNISAVRKSAKKNKDVGRSIYEKREQQKRIKKEIEEVHEAQARSKSSEANQVTDVWALDQPCRFRLYRSWINLLYCPLEIQLKYSLACYKVLADEIRETYSIRDGGILKRALVVGLTTTGAAKHRSMMSHVKPTITIVEEAAEVLEAHISTLLSSHCEHLILIGDHQQLRPNPAVYRLVKEYNLDISLFERMVQSGMCFSQLNMQHRMRPEISQLITPHIYKTLYNHPSVLGRDNILGISGNVLFVDHHEVESKVADTTSKSNEHEAMFIVRLVRYLLCQEYQASQITVLTMYQGQTSLVKKKMANFREDEIVRVTPVDNFQGEENDIILLSCVRSNADNNIGFLKVSNRVCVALSRARKGFYCVGNIGLLRKVSPLWSKICCDLDKDKRVVDGIPCLCQNHPDTKFIARFPVDFDKAPFGGCTIPCSFRLQCGHVCRLECHPFDKDHVKYDCLESCTKFCLQGHMCTAQCYMVCPPCQRLMAKVIPKCGHKQMVACHLDPEKFICQITCYREKPCGHICTKACGEECLPCHELVVKTLSKCGHDQMVPCHQDPKEFNWQILSDRKCTLPCEDVLHCGHTCREKCGDCDGKRHTACSRTCSQNLPCGHLCAGKCGESCPPCNFECQGGCSHGFCEESCRSLCSGCLEPCEWNCPHMRCDLTCWDPCKRPPCNFPCSKSLMCGHQCSGLCGEECPQVCKMCHAGLFQQLTRGRKEMLIVLDPCHHVFTVTQLDAHFKLKKLPGGHQKVQTPSCPACGRAVRVCNRYNTIIKQAALDLNRVK